jgi:dipeptidyl aminopeptidase/acylaminoacyl peptidase/formylglycine-generating enzyme required for sulfatase activity
MVRCSRSVLVLFLCLLGSGIGAGGDKRAKEASVEAWTADDVVNQETARDFRVSPDGRWVVWVKRAPDKDKGEIVSHLMLSSLTEKNAIQLTRGKDGAANPRWSPDGKLIAFLSARPAPKTKSARDDDDKDEPKSQVWLINPSGGEPWVLTQSPRDVRDLAWAGPEHILYVAQEKPSLQESTLKEKKDTSQVVEDEPNEPPVRLFKIGLKTSKAFRLSDNKDRIQSLAVSPDGKHAVTIHERSLSYTFDHKIKPAAFLYDLDKAESKQVFEGKNIQNVHWQPDGKGFYAVNAFTNHPRFLMAYVLELYYFDVARGQSTKVSLDWPRGLIEGGDGFAATADGFVALLADGVRHKAVRFVRNGTAWKHDELDGEHVRNLFALHVAQDGKTAIYEHSAADRPPRWYHARLEGGKLAAPTLLADLQAELAKKPLSRAEIVRWKGALGEEIEGLLHYPHNYQAGKKYPLVVMIHGGPFGADFDGWEETWAYPPNLVCAKGAFVLKPNYHGSSNYGLAFAESIGNGKYYLPVEDVEKGIDHLIAKGLVEPKKVALSGWSNGAILTMSLITRRHYAAAAAGAGGSEWVADWGACEFGMSFSNYYLGKAPYEDPKLYAQNAPWYDFPKVRTPTLLFHGSEDRVVPTHHGWMQFRALQQIGKTDVRFLLFPGEKHSLKKLAHQKRKLTEEMAWLDKYLFQTAKADNLALKANSPLARALALREAKKDGRLYGVRAKDVLVPETISYEALQVGRFEVTRAQFAQFDKTYAIEPGTENYPANGITLAQAKDYCAWLSKMTGETYRLGTVDELESLYDSAEEPENTLDFWAGYGVNPEDKARLEEKIRALPGKAPLLKEVGCFRSLSDKNALFDVGGNVAEWVLDADGQGKVLGGSADTPAEQRTRRPAPEYIGFRVVRGAGSPAK